MKKLEVGDWVRVLPCEWAEYYKVTGRMAQVIRIDNFGRDYIDVALPRQTPGMYGFNPSNLLFCHSGVLPA